MGGVGHLISHIHEFSKLLIRSRVGRVVEQNVLTVKL